MRPDDHETPTVDAAASFERGHSGTEREWDEECGYDPLDDTLGGELYMRPRKPIDPDSPLGKAIAEVRRIRGGVA